MPTKHNKIRYRARSKPRPVQTLSGTVYLQYRDDTVANFSNGDLLLYPSVEALHTFKRGEYDTVGYSGYFKIDVYDGKDWLPLLAQDFFTGREQYFSKTERPSDTFMVCANILKSFKGREVRMAYREHYRLVDAENLL